MEENEKIHNAKIKSKLVNVNVGEVYFCDSGGFFPLNFVREKGTVIAGLIQFFFYNGKYKYEQDFNKKLTISHTAEAKKAFNST